MPSVFPNLSTGDAWLTPAVRTLSLATRVVRFLDDTEQRWRAGNPLNAWTLTFSAIPWADVATLRNFFDTVKGAFDPTWTFPFLGTNYLTMVFEQDDFTAVEGEPGKFTVNLKFRQTAQSGTYASGSVTTYPTLGTGAITQRPFTSKPAWLTTRNDLPTGAHYAWSNRAAALPAWICDYSVLTATELGVYFDFFCKVGGRYRPFTFRDPNTATDYTNCRLDMDALQIHYLGAGQSATSLQVIQVQA